MLLYQAEIKDQSDFFKAENAKLKDQIANNSLRLEGLESTRL
jgi:hypothetical protein